MFWNARLAIRIGVTAGLCFVLAGCEDILAPDADYGIRVALVDGRNEGNGYFFFQQPIAPDPGASGSLDATLHPVVVISADGEPDIELAASVDPTAEHYQVDWHTREYVLDPAKTYKITVEVEGFELGYADVNIVRSGGTPGNGAAGETIALRDGRTLPIRFRIEEGWRTPFAYAYSLHFDGVDDYVDFGQLGGFDAAAGLSMEFVFRWDGPNANTHQYLLSFGQAGPGHAYAIFQYDPDRLLFGVAQCNCVADQASWLSFEPTVGQWHHALYTYDTADGGTRLFVDGELVAQGSYPFTGYLTPNNSSTGLGAYYFYHEPIKFVGNVAFARLVNDVVDLQPFPSLEPPYAASLFHLTFSEGDGLVVGDDSGHGHDGQIHGGATWSTEVPGR